MQPDLQDTIDFHSASLPKPARHSSATNHRLFRPQAQAARLRKSADQLYWWFLATAAACSMVGMLFLGDRRTCCRRRVLGGPRRAAVVVNRIDQLPFRNDG